MSTAHVVLPEGTGDPTRPSGGNIYDRRVCAGLTALGWRVREHAVPGSWPAPDPAARRALAGALGDIPDASIVLVDGLIGSTAAAELVPEARRLQLVVLVHMPLGDAPAGHEVVGARSRERAVLRAATAVVATSRWTRAQLVHRYGLPPDRVHVAEPGTDDADLAAGTPDGGALLCVAAVAPHKGHDVLLAALAGIADTPWRCVCVGAVDRDPSFVDELRRAADAYGVSDRFCFSGVRAGGDLERAYAAADALVLASRAESYGMVVTEALARGLPVVATTAGGLPEALGRTPDGRRPGMLVPPGDQRALTVALHRWLQDAELRQQLRSAARDRRPTLPTWTATTERVVGALTGAAPREATVSGRRR